MIPRSCRRLSVAACGAAGAVMLTIAPAGATGVNAAARVDAGSVLARDEQPVGTNRLVDVTVDGTPTSKGSSAGPLSGDGRFVALGSAAQLVENVGRNPRYFHAYLADRRTGDFTLIDATPSGRPGKGSVQGLDMSADTSRYVFISSAKNLTSDRIRRHANGVFLRDTATGAMTMVVKAPDGKPADKGSSDVAISADGSTIVFASSARNLIAGDKPLKHSTNVFRHDVATGVTSLVSASSEGGYPREWGYAMDPHVSADGNVIVYVANPTDIVPGMSGSYQVILYDVAAGTSSLVCRTAEGEPVKSQCNEPAISSDGSTIAFVSDAPNLLPERVKGREEKIYLFDVATAVTSLATRSYDGGFSKGSSSNPDLSEDGTVLTFDSQSSNLVPADTNRRDDVFLQDTVTGETALISRDLGGEPADGHSNWPSISDNGSVIAYGSVAPDIVGGIEKAAPRVYAYRVS